MADVLVNVPPVVQLEKLQPPVLNRMHSLKPTHSGVQRRLAMDIQRTRCNVAQHRDHEGSTTNADLMALALVKSSKLTTLPRTLLMMSNDADQSLHISGMT